MRVLLSLLLLLCVLLAPAAAGADDAVRLEALLVQGEQPGPGLWRVSRGEHELWILGTQAPLPRRMRWRATEVEALLPGSGELLSDAQVEFNTGLGMMRSMLLVPSLLGARRNPDGQRLADLLPAELHARWTVLRDRWLRGARRYEQWRPLFAAEALYSGAIARSGMRDDGAVWKQLEKSARRQGVAVTRPTVTVTIAEPKQSLQQFRALALDDVDCLRTVVERLETDLESMRARANAWAIGDLERLRELPHPDNRRVCQEALLRANLGDGVPLAELPGRIRAAWLQAATAALATHRRSVAVVSLRNLLAPEGYLAALREQGYSIEEPE